MTIEEEGDIDRLRRRFPNSMPNFLEGGHYYRSWEEIGVYRYFKIPPYPIKSERPGERMAY